MQANNFPLIWSNIDRNSINEFQTSGYIACAFLILYPTEAADLHFGHAIEIKLAKYFIHLIKYKNRRFTHHIR